MEKTKTGRWVKVLSSFDALNPLLIKVLFEVAYVRCFSKYYAYLGEAYTPNWNKMVISWMAAIVFSFIRKTCRHTRLTVFANIFLYMNVIPCLSVYWLKDQSSMAFFLIVLYWLIWYAVTAFFNNKEFTPFVDNEKPAEVFVPKDNNIIYILGFCFICITTIVFSATHGGFRFFIAFDDVYTYRLMKDNSMGRIAAYIFAWNTNVLIPIYMCIHIVKKKRLLFFADAALMLLSYGIYGNKSMLFSIPLIIGVIILYEIRAVEYTDLMISVFIIFYFVLMLVTSNLTIIALGDRMLQGPPAGHYNYYDFFSDIRHPFLYLRESIFRVFSESPYPEMTSVVIGSSSKYYSGAYNNMNNGLFSVAYSNFGVVGVLLHPIILVTTFFYTQKVADKYSPVLQYTFIILHSLYISSTTYTSWWISGGLLIEVLFLFILMWSEKAFSNRIIDKPAKMEE